MSLSALEQVLSHFIDYRNSIINNLEHNFLQVIIPISTDYRQTKTGYFDIQNSLMISISLENFNRTTSSHLSQLNGILINSVTTYKEQIDKQKNALCFLQSVFFTLGNSIQNNAENNKTTSCNFNPFRLFNIDEKLHSKLLEKLLNPKAEHGQGKQFLTAFLNLLQIEKPEEGNWLVTTETGGIDILLRRSSPESIVIIENKSKGAIDQKNQLYRYWHQEIYLKTRETNVSFYEQNRDKYKIIYLPPNNSKQPATHTYLRPNDERWIKKNLPEILPLKLEVKAFDDFVVQWLQECIIKLPKTNYRMVEYLKQYIEICETL